MTSMPPIGSPSRPGLWPPPLVLEPLAPMVELLPLAALLELLHATVLVSKPGLASEPVPERLRCGHCHSPHTRMKASSLLAYPARGRITGVSLRCRVCGGVQIYELEKGLR